WKAPAAGVSWPGVPPATWAATWERAKWARTSEDGSSQSTPPECSSERRGSGARRRRAGRGPLARRRLLSLRRRFPLARGRFGLLGDQERDDPSFVSSVSERD